MFHYQRHPERFSERFGALIPLICLDSGINKPFDRAAKEFAEEAPLVFVRLLGMVPPGVDVRLEQLRPETAPQVVMPDYVASLAIPGQEICTLHVEFFLQYRRDIPATMARYGGSLAWQYQRPVQSVLLLLHREGVPDQIPASGEYAIGETRTVHPFRTVRLWELDPEPVLTAGNPGLLPWALLMRLGRDEAVRLGSELGRTGNEQWVARFLTLGSLRYDRKELEKMLGGQKMGLVEVIMEGSSLVREARDQARVEGRAEGKAEGQFEETRRLLRVALAERFPGLEQATALDQIATLADLDPLFIQALRTTDRAAMEQAIQSAARQV